MPAATVTCHSMALLQWLGALHTLRLHNDKAEMSFSIHVEFLNAGSRGAESGDTVQRWAEDCPASTVGGQRSAQESAHSGVR